MSLLECLLALSLSTIVTSMMLSVIIQVEPALRYTQEAAHLLDQTQWMSHFLSDTIHRTLSQCLITCTQNTTQSSQLSRGCQTVSDNWPALKPEGSILLLGTCPRDDIQKIAFDLEDSHRRYADHQPIVSLYQREWNSRRQELLPQVSRWALSVCATTPEQSQCHWYSTQSLPPSAHITLIEVAWVLRSLHPVLKHTMRYWFQGHEISPHDKYFYLPWVIRVAVPKDLSP